jgi:hypothetical protein
MSEIERLVRANSKRRSTKKRGRRSSLRISPVKPTEVPLVALAEMVTQSMAEKTAQLAIQQAATPSAPQPSLGDRIGELVLEAAKAAYNESWKKTDPESYLVYQATWAVAPNWPQDWGWLLNLTAMGALIRGASRIADNGKKRDRL